MFENDDAIDADKKREEKHDASTDLHLPSGYLSYSQCNLYMNCGERYRRTYVLKNKRPGSSNMAHGRLMHSAIENMLLYKRDHNEVLPDADFHQQFLTDNLEDYFKEVDTWEEKIPDLAQAEKTSRRLLDLYYEKRMPDVRVRAVEIKVQGTIRERIPFLGYVDLIERSPMDITDFSDEASNPYAIKPTDAIIDNKIVGRKYPPSRVENSLQLTVYAHLLKVEDVGYDLVVETKKARKISFVPQRAIRSYQEKEHGMDVIEGIAESISAGVFIKADPDSWMCSKKWCPFWDDCRGKTVQVPVNKPEEVES